MANANMRKTIGAIALAGAVLWGSDVGAFVVVDGFGSGTPPSGSGGTPDLELGGGPGPTLEASPIPTAIRLRFAVAGPDKWLCAKSNGGIFVRSRCRSSEDTIDPSALRLCRTTAGVLRLTATTCGKRESTIDMRRVRGVTPSAWRQTPVAAVAAETGAFEKTGPGLFGAGVTAPKDVFGKETAPSNDPDPVVDDTSPGFTALEPKRNLDATPIAPMPDVRLEIRDGLCRRKNGSASLHRLCPTGESPIGPDALRSCVKKSGALELRGTKCAKGAKSVDLRTYRTPGAPVGIGPLVGIVPRLADLADEYPGL